jgi:hypothetical protein
MLDGLVAIQTKRIHKARCTLIQRGYGLWWYEHGCGEPRWKTSMIFVDAIHAQEEEKGENSVMLEAS